MSAYEARFYPFQERPLSDTCWSLSAGPDGRIYAAACVEHTGGQSVSVVRYQEDTDSLEYLFDVDRVSGDLRDSGRATQCKIHYSFAPSPKDGLLYAATHLSGPPKGEQTYRAWGSWHDPKRAFRGAFLIAYDTVKERVAWSGLMIPKEGCRCLCLDEERGWLYALSYPRDHFLIFDLQKRELKDLGRIGSINCQCIFLDRRKRAYFSNDHGRMIRFDPQGMELETLPHVIPHAPYQTGWHGVLYDAVADEARGCIYLLPWMVNPRLMRFWPEEGAHGRMEDLGLATQERDPAEVYSLHLDHVGGLVFGVDGRLYFVKSKWPSGANSMEARAAAEGVVVRMDPETGVQEEVCVLKRSGGSSAYISRGARDRSGQLYFGHVAVTPSGFFRVSVPGGGRRSDAHLPLRMWG